MPASFEHDDPFRTLDGKAPLSEKLRLLHDSLRERYAFIDRIAIAVYDARLDMLKTFAWSSDTPSPLIHYQHRLGKSPSLMEIVEKGRPRVVNDMDIFANGRHTHSQVLADSGFGSSYTLPMYKDGEFMGFIFFNSYHKAAFRESVLNDLDMVGHILSLMVAGEKRVLETLQATVHSAMSFTHQRDPETATHIDRMSRYARLIARDLARQEGLDDAFVEHVFLFAPLHDLGKIGIPDRILLKPGPLTDEEFAVMKSHASKGLQMVDALLKNYGLDGIGYMEMLRNIACYHHEAWDGSGYPEGLKGTDIPLEARIVSVADVFDALTSERAYKPAWENERAYQTLREMAGHRLDANCVELLIAGREEVEQIQSRFQENPYG